MDIKGIFVLIISTAVFDLLFMQLNKLDPKAQSLFHKIPENWKGKWLIKWITTFILLLVNAYIKIYFRISDLLGYIIAGFIISLCDFAYKKPQVKVFPDWEEQVEDQLEQFECSNCGKTHDMDYPKCPYCKYKYNN